MRPAAPPKPDFPPLAEHLARLAQVRKNSQALCGGAYRQLHLTNQQMIFERALGEERIIIGLNISPDTYTAYFDAGVKEATDMLTGSPASFCRWTADGALFLLCRPGIVCLGLTDFGFGHTINARASRTAAGTGRKAVPEESPSSTGQG